MSTTHSEEAARALAAWLAPFIAKELGLTDRSRGGVGGLPLVADADVAAAYTPEVCSSFVSALGEKVLLNATTFFHALTKDGEIGSLQLAEMIGVGSPRNIPAVLTTPLKRRAKALRLPMPWVESTTPDDRTLWIGIDGLTRLMFHTLGLEIDRRGLGEQA